MIYLDQMNSHKIVWSEDIPLLPQKEIKHPQKNQILATVIIK